MSLIGNLTEDDVTFDYATSRTSDDNSESDDFTATSGTGTITGGSSSTTITVPTTDDSLNHPTNSVYEGDETFTVTISNPTVAGISQATAKGTILDDTDQPTLSFSSQSTNVDENAGTAVLTVNKAGATNLPAEVDYETVSRNTAIEGEDYVATSGTLTFQPAETSKTISVPIIDDNIYEGIAEQFDLDLKRSTDAKIPTDPILGRYSAAVSITSNDPVPVASTANVTASERAGTMTLTLRLDRPSQADISYFTNDSSLYRLGTATINDDYEISYDAGNRATITVPAGQLSSDFDIILIGDDLQEPDETIELRWEKENASQATPDEFTFTGTITDPPACDNLANTIVVKNLTGEIAQAGESQFHNIKLDPYRSYLIEAIGQNGQDMLGVEEHPNLTLSNPDIPAIWNAKGNSRWITYGSRNDGDESKNVIRRFRRTDYITYKSRSTPATTAPAPTSSRSGSTTSAASTTAATRSTNGQVAPTDTPPAPTYRPEQAVFKSC